MSLPRSIDRADLGGATVTVPTTTETVILTGPNLQTPKDTSVLAVIASLSMVQGTGATGLTLRLRMGSAVTGTQVGQPYVVTTPSSIQTLSVSFVVTFPSYSTDYVQVSLTAQQTAASGNGNVTAAAMLAISF